MNNQKGNILIYILLIVVVLSILSIGVYRLSYSTSGQANFTRDNTQAYYIAKAGVDIITDNIKNIKEEIGDNTQKYKLDIEFPNEGKAAITVELGDDDKEITINSTGIVNEQKPFESKSSIQAKLKFDSISGDLMVLGVGDDGVIYEFDKELEKYTLIYGHKSKDKKIPIPNAFAWNGKDRFVLVGSKDKNEHIQSLTSNDGIGWKELSSISDTKGKGFSYVLWAEEEKKFYATNTKEGGGSGSGHIFYMDEYGSQWKDFEPSNNSFKVEKLAQGNNIIVGISENKNSQITYFKVENSKWQDKTINGFGMKGVYNAITYGKGEGGNNGRFVIVGNEQSTSYPIFIYSDDGINWLKGEQVNPISGINYKLNDVKWTGEIFVAIGDAGTIYSSIDGEKWYGFPRRDIIKDDKLIGWGNYSNVSGKGNYIVAYSRNIDTSRSLVSTYGGRTWTEKNLVDANGIPMKLKDIIVVNKGNSSFGPENFKIQWSK